MSEIADSLAGRSIFVTGATGFLGQPLLEKILWACPDVRAIYVLIRPRRTPRGQVDSAEDRLERELLVSNVFDRLRSTHGERLEEFLREKVLAVSGDISQEGLGIEPQLASKLKNEIDVIMSSAAVVSFDAALDQALELNALGAKRVAEFACSCKKATLIHVSTAYVSGTTKDRVAETIYHSAAEGSGQDSFPLRQFRDVDQDIEHIRGLIDRIQADAHSPELEREFKLALLRRFRRSRGGINARRREKIESLRRKWIQTRLREEGMKWARQRGWNDTYTYTKALGEQMVVRHRGDVPTAIIRPSVIESSIAEPNPGWLDGLRMADPLIVAIGKGRLKSLPLNPDVVIDLVPVDMVVNALLGSLPTVESQGGLHIYQVATGVANPITLGELYGLVYRYFSSNPMLDREGEPIQVKRLRFLNPSSFRLQHRLKSVPLDTAEKTLDRLAIFDVTHRFKRKLSATRAARQRLYYYGEIYEPYLNLTCRFDVTNTLQLWAGLSEEDRKLFNFNVSNLNWRHYIQHIHIPGVKKYILKVEGAGALELEEPVSDTPPPKTITELLESTARRLPDKPALQMKRNGQWHRLTYSQLLAGAKRIAAQLYGRGLRQGDRVVLYSENQPEWGMAYFGAAYLGLVVTPLDAQTWVREVESVVRFTKAGAVLASPYCYERFQSGMAGTSPPACQKNWLNVNQFCAAFRDPESSAAAPVGAGTEDGLGEIEIHPDDPVSILFTTGTTVNPKGAVHTHRSFLSNVLGVNRYVPISEGDQLLSVLPLYHALEFTCGFLMAIYGGATIAYARSLKPKRILETMRETGTTCMLGVPTLYSLIWDDIERRILKASKSSLKQNWMTTSKQLSRSVERRFGKNIGRQLFAKVHQESGGNIRLFVSGGSKLSEELYADFKALGMPIYEGYGLTETAPVLTVNPLNLSRSGSAGKPLPGVELRISHPDQDGIGEILVRTPSLMQGYFQNGKATKSAVRQGWFHTGDLGWVDEDGYVYVTGRIKDVIVTGAGKNVYPEDLEAIYQSIPCVREICVVGLKNALTEDVHGVVVTSRANPSQADPQEERLWVQRAVQKLARELPSYQRLQGIHVRWEPLPRDDEGRLRRDVVRAQVQKQLQENASKGTARSVSGEQGAEKELLGQLSVLTGIPVEEIHDESHLYSDLGLDSLMIIEMLLFVERRFGVSIADEEAPDIQTVGEMFAELSRQHPTQPRRPPRVRSALAYPQRPLLDQALLSFSFMCLKGIYRSYFRLTAVGSRIPRGGAYVLAANHSSHLDTGAVIAALGSILGVGETRRLHVLGARDYFFDHPLKGWFFGSFLNVVPIEREETSLAGLRLARSILKSGEPVLIYPEGTRSRNGQLGNFKPGLGLIAADLEVPIVPVRILGTHTALPPGRTFPRPQPIRVIFGSPIRVATREADQPADLMYRRLAAEVRTAIEELGLNGD